MDWKKIELNAKQQTSRILTTRVATHNSPLPQRETRVFEKLSENERNHSMESYDMMLKNTSLQGVVESHEDMLRGCVSKVQDSNQRLQSIETSQRVISERLDELQTLQEQQMKVSSSKSSDAAESLVSTRALMRRIETLEETIRATSHDIVTKPLFTQLVDTCMDQLGGLRSVTQEAQQQASDAFYHVETTLQAIAQLKSSKFGFQLDYLKGLSRDAQRSQLSLLIRDAIDGAIQRLFSEHTEKSEAVYRNELSILKEEQQRFQKDMLSRFRVLEASTENQSSSETRLEEVLVQVQRMQRKLDGEVKHTAAALAAMESDVQDLQLKMETQLRPVTNSTQQTQREMKDLLRKTAEYTEKVQSLDILLDEVRNEVERNKSQTATDVNKLRRELPNIDAHVTKLESSLRVLEEGMETIQSELATMDDLIVSVKAAGDTRVKAVQQLSEEVKVIKNEGCSLAKQCVSRLYAIQNSQVQTNVSAAPVSFSVASSATSVRLENVPRHNIPAISVSENTPTISVRDATVVEKPLHKPTTPPSLASRVESLRKNVQSTIEKYEITTSAKPALSIDVSDLEIANSEVKQSPEIVLSPQKNIAVGDIDESMSLSSDDESDDESACPPPTDSPIPTISKASAQAAASQPLVMSLSSNRAATDNNMSDILVLSPSKNINPDDIDESVTFESSSDGGGPETTPSPDGEQMQYPTRSSPEVSENELSEAFTFDDSLSRGANNETPIENEDCGLQLSNNNGDDAHSCDSSVSSDSFDSEGNDDAANENMTLPVVDSLGNLVMPQGRKPPHVGPAKSQRTVDPPATSGSLLDSSRASSRGKPPTHLSALPWIGGGTPPLLNETDDVTSPRPVSAPLPRSNTTGNIRPGLGPSGATAQCPYCLRRVVVQEMKVHQLACELRPELCKFGCGAKVIALKMEKHLEHCSKNPKNNDEDDDSFS